MMLDDYKETQNIAYNIMTSEISSDKISHAYLIDENGNNDSFNIVLAFVKSILCQKKYTSRSNCMGCNICERIDNNNYPELTIIYPDGNLIKKQQILDLQQNFSRSAIEGNKRIYIIRYADRMRPETANSMLKFLEEPENDLIAILMTNNYNNILPTIISRCQVIKLNAIHNVPVESEYEKIVLEFIESIEQSYIKALVNVKSLWFDSISSKNKDDMLNAFDIMIDYYYDILKLKLGISNIKYDFYLERLKCISEKNSSEGIINKIKFLLDSKDSIKFNVNSGLLIDNLIVNIGGNYEGSWN